MKKNLIKRLLIASILTTCISAPVPFLFAQEYDGLSNPNGGAIDNSIGGTVNVENGSVFTNNAATAPYYGGGAIYNAAGQIIVGDDVRFESNYLTGVSTGNDGTAGGAVSSWGGGSVSIGNNAQFINNGYTNSSHATVGSAAGGAIYVSGGGNGNDPQGSLTILDGAIFSGNATNGSGGAIYAEGSSVSIGNGAVFSGNSSYSGGAVYNLQYNDVESKIEIGDNATFSNNTVTDNSGGAVANFGGTFETGKNANFSGNTAGYGGGAIRNSGTAVIGEGAQFTNNTSLANDGYGGGGALDNSGNITINGGSAEQDTLFSGNNADLGGAIFNNGTINLNAGNGDIVFSGNNDKSGKNDIFMNDSSSMNLGGTNTISIGSGIASVLNSTATITNNGSNLVLESGSVNTNYTGSFVQESGTTEVNTAFFGGVSTIKDGSLSMNDNSSIIDSAKVNIEGGDMTIQGDADVSVAGSVSTSGTGKVINNGNLLFSGSNSSFEGKLEQKDGNAVTTIDNGATIKITDSAVNVIEGGTIKFGETGKLDGNLSVTEAVKIEIAGDEDNIIDGTGLQVGSGGHIVSDGGLNLAGDYLIQGGILGTSIIVTEGSINSQPAGSDITINDPHTLTLSNNATSDKGFIVNQNGTLKLAPTEDGSLTLEEQNKITGDGNILVDEIVITKQVLDPSSTPDNPIYTTVTEHMGVGTITINSDNSAFTGNYEQNDGHVIVSNGATFFAGQKNDINGGILDLHDGAILKTTIDANADPLTDEHGTVLIRNEIKGTGEDGALTANDLNTAQNTLTYVNSDNSEVAININQAGLGLFNNTVINEDVTLEGTGAKHLLFGDGSGINGDIALQDGTSLTYADDAFVKQDSTLTLNNAELIFANDKNVNYNPVIQGAGTISMIGDGTTSIASALNEQINIAADYGTLNLNNTSTTGLGDIAVDGAKLNVAAKELAAVGTIDVSGDGAAANFSGNILNGGNASVSGGASLGLFGNATLGNLNLDGILNTMGGNIINTINVNDLTVGKNSSVSFDVDPRTQATDVLNAGNIINNGNNQILVSGINFTRSPIDYNVLFDISNVVQQGGTAAGQDLIKLPDGGVIANSAMGQYLITSSGAGNPILNASLLALNPQMYRGQVATLASWQNQLVVNNMLFDHMNVLTRQLMDEEKTANKYAAAYPQFAPYQYDLKGGSLWYKAYGNFERLSMTRGLSVGNNAYGSLIGADFPLIKLKNGWNLVPTAYIAYNGAHQTFNGVSMYQNGAQLGFMGTAYKGDFITSLLAYGGGYANDMSVRGQYGSGSDTTGNWFAGVASKTAYNFHLPYDLIFQPTFMAAYNAFGQQNWGSNFGAMSMSSGMLNGINVAPGFNLIWQKKTFSIYATAQMVYNVMGGVDGKAGNIDLGYVRMRHSYFEYGLGVMKKFKDRFTGYLQITFRNGGRTGVGFQGGLQWKIGK